MKNKCTIKGICSLAFVSASCLIAVAAVNIFNFEKLPQTKAEQSATVAEATDFTLNNTTAVWIGDKNNSGLRFNATVTENYINSFENVKSMNFWTIIAPSKNVTSASELTVDNYEEKQAVIINAKEVPSFNPDDGINESFTYTGGIKYNFSDTEAWTEDKQQALFDLPLVARPCLAITYNDNTYEYVYGSVENVEEKNIRATAEKALIAEATNVTEHELSENGLNVLLSYAKSENVKAYHAADDVNTLAFIDNTILAGYNVYKKEIREDGRALFTQIGSLEAGTKATLTENIFKETELNATGEFYLCNGTDFIKTYATQVTKIIYDAEDLQLFDFDGLTTADDCIAAQISGSYVLANDIVDTENVYNAESPYFQWAYGAANPLGWNLVSKVGFYGSFDGLGHSLTIKTQAGLFPAVFANVTIKNVEFKDCTVTPKNSQYNSLIGKVERSNVKFENISISLTQDTYTSFTTNPTTNNQGYTLYILPVRDNGTAHQYQAKNVVFKCDYGNMPTADATITNRSITFALALGTASNVYVLEANKFADETYALQLKLTDSTEQDKVKSFDSYKAIREYFATEEGKAAFATFSEDWSMEMQDYPVWASSYDEMDYVEYLGTGIFSGWDNESAVAAGFAEDTDGDNQVLPSNFVMEGNVTGVYLADSVNTVNDFTPENNLFADGKVNITNTLAKQIVYKNIYITTDAGRIYKATLEVYTRIINTKEDLRMFDLDGIGASGRLLNGYYILGNDIVDVEETYNEKHILDTYNSIRDDKPAWANWAKTVGFSGVFDGRGYTLTVKTGTGLFGASIKAGSQIKNVNFKDCIIVKNNYYGSVLGDAGSTGIVVENIFISLAQETYDNYSTDSAPDLYVLMRDSIDAACCVTARNVIFELDYSKLPTAETTSEKRCIAFISKLASSFNSTILTKEVYVVKLNYDEAATYAREFKAIANEASSKGTVNVYNSYEALKEYFETEAGQTSLTTFSSMYWDVTNGYPVWKVDAE